MTKTNHLTTLILLISLLLSNAIYGQDPEQKMSSKQIKLLVDSLCDAMKREYIYPDKAVLISNYIKSEFKKGSYNKAKNKFELGQLLSNNMQQIFKDGHLSIRFDPQLTAQLETPWKAMTEAVRQKQYEMDVKGV
jgi:retinol-binding protein 3